MKKAILLFTIIGILWSCSNGDDNNNNKLIEQNITLSGSEKYEYNLGGFGDEDDAKIVIQAKHFEVSEFLRDNRSGEILYKYRAQSGYVGADFVEIKTEKGSDGASPSTEFTTLKITFTITE